jgi:hypothetical protein
MNPKNDPKKSPKTGQGYNDSRGEIPDKEDIPKHNGQNVNNDPDHARLKRIEKDQEDRK